MKQGKLRGGSSQRTQSRRKQEVQSRWGRDQDAEVTSQRCLPFAVVFAVLSAEAVVLTLNVQLLGGSIIFFQRLSLLGYCLFPLEIGVVVCLLKSSKWFRTVVVLVTLIWSSWSAYPFVSTAVPASRKALAVYPVLLLYISIGFLVLAND
ncbi:unnamed protein product [Calypogeia fissa]